MNDRNADERGSRTPASRWTRLIAFVLALGAGGPAASLDLPIEHRIYAEDLQGETMLPTQPEQDLLVLGSPVEVLTPPGAPPDWIVLDGIAARFTVEPVGSTASIAALSVAVEALASESVALRGRFSGFDPGAPFFSSAQTAVAVSARFERFATADLVAKLVVRRTAAGDLDLAIELAEDGSVFPFISTSVTLAASERLALLGGTAFVLDLEIEREVGGLVGSLAIDGLPTRGLGPATAPDLATASMASVDAVLGSANLSPGEAAGVDLESFEVFLAGSILAVDTTKDDPDASPGDGQCASAVGECSLRAAVQESNQLPGRQIVRLPAGEYFLDDPGADEDAALTGDLDITSDWFLLGDGRGTTVIDGARLDRVFDVRPLTSDPLVRIANVTIRNGSAETPAGPLGGGLVSRGTVLLERCRVAGNRANDAAGIMNHGELTLDDCVVEDNQALALGFLVASTGGIASAPEAGGGLASTSIVGSSVVRNVVAVANPLASGGVSFVNGQSSRIENSTISGNTGAQVSVVDTDLVLDHATIVGGDDPGVVAASTTGSHTLEFVHAAIESVASCVINPFQPVTTIATAPNASSSSGCGFSGSGSTSGAPLLLLPLVRLGDVPVHWPLAGSPLLEAGDAGVCLPTDQVGSARPLDSDGSGTSECDLGAIEVPEPGLGVGVALGALLFAIRGPSRRACSADARGAG